MTERSGRSLAAGPLLAILVAVLITVDFFLILDHRMPTSLIHTLIVGFFIVAANKLVSDHSRKAAVADAIAGMAAVAASIDARRCCCTEPTVPLRVIATATVGKSPAPSDELPGYAKGYADGLSRKPMEDAKILPINGSRSS